MKKIMFPILLVCTALVCSSCTEARTADLKPPTPVKVQSVESFSANNGLRYSATIRPAKQVELAFKNGGFVDAIHRISGQLVDKGNVVTKGTVLARVRQTDFENRLDQANSQLAEARSALESVKAKYAENKAVLERAEQDFVRAETLFNSLSLTKTNYDRARAEYQTAQAKLDSVSADIDAARSRVIGAEAHVAEASLALQDTAIVTPAGGTLLERKIEIGSFVPAGQAAFVLAETHTMKAVFGVPDLEVHKIKLGTLLTVTSEAAPDLKFQGRVTSVAPAADEKSRIFETEVTIPNPGEVLKAGMIASVVVPGAAMPETFAAVPLSAVIRSKNSSEGYAVFVLEMLDHQPLARLRPVTLGDAFGNMIVAKDGLAIGERVITVGATLVKDGAPVQIVP